MTPSLPVLRTDHHSDGQRVCVCVCVAGHTEALLEALSSSLLVGGATPFRERGEEAGALRRDLGGLA